MSKIILTQGIQGSGKTTTFRAITNEILLDSGNLDQYGIIAT